MRATTIDDQLAEARRRIDRLEALAQIDAAVGASPRTRRDLDALHEGAASVLAAARRATDEAEGKIGQLEARLAVAEHAVTADVANDWETFAAGVEGELRSWKTYLERLQTSVAANGWGTRAQAQTAIAAVHSLRSAVYDQLLQAGTSAGDDRQEQRHRVAAARDELARTADELSTTLSWRRSRWSPATCSRIALELRRVVSEPGHAFRPATATRRATTERRRAR